MYALHKFHSRSEQIGRPLPDPFLAFQDVTQRVKFRYGATSMIAGQPGSFKSVFALNMAVRWSRDYGLPILYFSADSDEFTVAKRCAGIITGEPSYQIEAEFKNTAKVINHYGPQMAKALGNVRFEYRALDMDEIHDRMQSFEQAWGEFPSVVFLDNLMDYVESEDEWGRMRQMTRDLDVLARETMSHIVILHHAGEGKVQAGQPVPRQAVQGHVTQKPRIVLTTWATENALGMACVKNSNGPQYPNAERWMSFSVQPSLEIEEVLN